MPKTVITNIDFRSLDNLNIIIEFSSTQVADNNKVLEFDSNINEADATVTLGTYLWLMKIYAHY